MAEKYSHSHDAVSVVDRLPLLLMITVSIGFGIFPGHLYSVVRSGVDPLIARITHVVPVAGQPIEGLPTADGDTPGGAPSGSLVKVADR
jgi:NADH-quinone oxidoreductase subunit M